MRKWFNSFISIMIVLLLSITLVSCSNKTDDNNSSNNNGTTEQWGSNYTYYLENESFEYNDLKISFNTNCTSSSNNFRATLYFTLLNKSPQIKYFSFLNAKIIRESNNASYDIKYLLTNETIVYSLECDIPEEVSGYATIPTSLETDNYKFVFTLDNKEITIHLYETNESMREQLSVQLIIDGNVVETRQIANLKLFEEIDWVSSDFLYGCNTWYSDSSCQNVIDKKDRIDKSTLSLYGKKIQIIQYKTISYINKEYGVNGFNFIPTNGVIVIPSVFNGYKVTEISSLTYNLDIVDLYIPKSITDSSPDLHKLSKLKNIYFEGTQTEWNAMYRSNIPEGVTIHYNTYI